MKKCLILRVLQKCLVLRLILVYFLVVFISAIINYLHFQKDSTSFLISDQLNKRIERYEFKSPEKGLSIYIKSRKDSIPLTIEEFQSMVKPPFMELDRINDSLVFQRKAFERDSIAIDSLLEIISVIRSDSIAVITKNEMAPYQHKIDEIERSMIGKDSLVLAIEGKYVELAEARVDYARKNAELQASINEQYATLMPNNLKDDYLEQFQHYIETLISIRRLETSRLNIYDKIGSLSAAFHNNRIQTVGFWDFLYYSVCVSTTVSFGDIAPNDSFTRTWALIELLLCVGIVGYIVNSIAPRGKSKDE